VREALRGLTLRQRALNIWVFVGDVREEFILGHRFINLDPSVLGLLIPDYGGSTHL
jgi:hypothetical protein